MSVAVLNFDFVVVNFGYETRNDRLITLLS